MSAAVSLERVTKVYPNGLEAVTELDLEIGDGELLVLVGPSGCGKTTVLRMVAGLERITSGTLRIGGRVMNKVSSKDRDIAMVFQNYALYPHMTVEANIAFALRLRHVPKAEIKRRVADVAELLGLADLLRRRPAQLSGGQRQRVAMGRAIVREPTLFLMDEPLSNLDAKLRVQMRTEISRLQRHLGVATLFVTHDQVEAMTLGDRVAIMRSGRLHQMDAPQAVYDRPTNMFVAEFIGSPAMNLYRAKLEAGALTLGSQTITLSEPMLRARPLLERYQGRELVIGIRPEHLYLDRNGHGAVVAADVDLVEALGSDALVHFTIDASRAHSQGATVADDLGSGGGELVVSGEGVARVAPSLAPTAGTRVRFALDVDDLHFFDATSGEAIWS